MATEAAIRVLADHQINTDHLALRIDVLTNGTQHMLSLDLVETAQAPLRVPPNTTGVTGFVQAETLVSGLRALADKVEHEAGYGCPAPIGSPIKVGTPEDYQVTSSKNE